MKKNQKFAYFFLFLVIRILPDTGNILTILLLWTEKMYSLNIGVCNLKLTEAVKRILKNHLNSREFIYIFCI